MLLTKSGYYKLNSRGFNVNTCIWTRRFPACNIFQWLSQNFWMLTRFQFLLDSLTLASYLLKDISHFCLQEKAELDLVPLLKFEIELFVAMAVVTYGSTLDIGRGPGYPSYNIYPEKLPNACYYIFWKPSTTKNIKTNKIDFKLHGFYLEEKAELDLVPLLTFETELNVATAVVTYGSTLDIARGLGHQNQQNWF